MGTQVAASLWLVPNAQVESQLTRPTVFYLRSLFFDLFLAPVLEQVSFVTRIAVLDVLPLADS